MRSFGCDKPEFLEFTLGKSKKVYRIPLAGSMPLKFTQMMAEATAIEDEDKMTAAVMECEHAILSEYIGEKATDMLTASDVGEIFTALNEESDAQGASLGE